jgi:hypothetical protein
MIYGWETYGGMTFIGLYGLGGLESGGYLNSCCSCSRVPVLRLGLEKALYTWKLAVLRTYKGRRVSKAGPQVYTRSVCLERAGRQVSLR